MKLVDLHSDTIYKMYRLGITDINDPSLHVSLERLLLVDSLLQCSSIYNPRFEEGYSYTELKKQYAFYRSIIEGVRNSVQVLEKFDDIDGNYRKGIRTILMTIEDAGPVEDRLERIEELYRMGVRLMTLTWNHENCFGFPNSRDREETERGLKPFGMDVVALMNRLGMVIDVSHLSDGGIVDVCRLSGKPIVASHSNCRALSNHPRNLSDPLIRAIADGGGAVGVSVEPNFIGPGREAASLERWIAHIDHLVKIGGSGIAAIGTDFDGTTPGDIFEITDITGLAKLERALRARGYSEDFLEALFYRNALRVLKENLK